VIPSFSTILIATCVGSGNCGSGGGSGNEFYTGSTDVGGGVKLVIAVVIAVLVAGVLVVVV
jgi:hypothetical protein